MESGNNCKGTPPSDCPGYLDRYRDLPLHVNNLSFSPCTLPAPISSSLRSLHSSFFSCFSDITEYRDRILKQRIHRESGNTRFRDRRGRYKGNQEGPAQKKCTEINPDHRIPSRVCENRCCLDGSAETGRIFVPFPIENHSAQTCFGCGARGAERAGYGK